MVTGCAPLAMKADGARATSLVKHSLVVSGHATSISLERAFWSALQAHAASRGCSVAKLVAAIDATREGANLSSAIRVFLLQAGPVEARTHP